MKSVENNPIGGFYHILLVEGEYLDTAVNEQRDDFWLPKEPRELIYPNKLSFEELFEAIDPTIRDLLTPPDWIKEEIIEGVQKRFGITAAMISNAKVRVQYGDTEDRVVRRVLASFNEMIIQDTAKIFDLKAEILELDPRSDEFRKKVEEMSWKHTASLETIDMANLSQVIVRRASMVDVLRLAVRRRLSVQVSGEGKRDDERIIHNVFFPRGRDSVQVENHDIWLLSEDYQYFDYIASDMALSSVKWGDDFLFESDVDQELQKLLTKNLDANVLKRPDIAIFSNEGSLIIIEFKAPDVELSDHTQDLMEYAQLLTAKSKGRIKKVYGYLIGTTLNPNRMVGYTKFPVGTSWFGTHNIMEHTTGTRLGELYGEVLYYDDIEPRRVCRRPFGLSYAAISGVSSIA